MVDITLKHLRWLPCFCPPKPSTSFAWPPGDIHQWSFSRSALKGGNHLFSKGSLFLRGLPCPREKQHLFYKEFLLISKTLLQAFFPKAATFLFWPPSETFFPIAADVFFCFFFAKAVGLLCFHAAFFAKAVGLQQPASSSLTPCLQHWQRTIQQKWQELFCTQKLEEFWVEVESRKGDRLKKHPLKKRSQWRAQPYHCLCVGMVPSFRAETHCSSSALGASWICFQAWTPTSSWVFSQKAPQQHTLGNPCGNTLHGALVPCKRHASQ